MKLIITRPNFLHFTKFTYESSAKLMDDIISSTNELIELKKEQSRIKYAYTVSCAAMHATEQGTDAIMADKARLKVEFEKISIKIHNYKIIKSECGNYELSPESFCGWVDNINNHIFVKPNIRTLDEWFDQV